MSNKAFTGSVAALNEQSRASSVYVISCGAECPFPSCRMTSAEKTGGRFIAFRAFFVKYSAVQCALHKGHM